MSFVVVCCDVRGNVVKLFVKQEVVADDGALYGSISLSGKVKCLLTFGMTWFLEVGIFRRLYAVALQTNSACVECY